MTAEIEIERNGGFVILTVEATVAWGNFSCPTPAEINLTKRQTDLASLLLQIEREDRFAGLLP